LRDAYEENEKLYFNSSGKTSTGEFRESPQLQIRPTSLLVAPLETELMLENSVKYFCWIQAKDQSTLYRFFTFCFVAVVKQIDNKEDPTFASKICLFLGLMAMYLSILHEKFNTTEVLVIALKPWIEMEHDRDYLANYSVTSQLEEYARAIVLFPHYFGCTEYALFQSFLWC
jgi:hypothetical protein